MAIGTFAMLTCRLPSRSVSITIRLSRTRVRLDCRRKKRWHNKDGCLMAKDSDDQLHLPGERAVVDTGPLRRSGRFGESFFPLAGLIRARSALFVAIAVSCSVGCASSRNVAASNSEPQELTPRWESSPVTDVLDNHTGQMAEEDQRRAEQAYKRVPVRSRQFRDEPIRPSTRP